MDKKAQSNSQYLRQQFDPERTYAIEAELLETYKRLIQRGAQGLESEPSGEQEDRLRSAVDLPFEFEARPPAPIAGLNFKSKWAHPTRTPSTEWALAGLSEHSILYSTPVYKDSEIQKCQSLWTEESLRPSVGQNPQSRNVVLQQARIRRSGKLSRPAVLQKPETTDNTNGGSQLVSEALIHFVYALDAALSAGDDLFDRCLNAIAKHFR